MTSAEMNILKAIKSKVSKHYGKWCIQTVDVRIAIARGMYGDKYGKDLWRQDLNEEESEKCEKIFDNLIKKGLIRYTYRTKEQIKAGGSCNYGFHMVIEKKFWDLYNTIPKEV